MTLNKMNSDTPFFIVNPNARSRKTGELWKNLKPRLRDKLPGFKWVLTLEAGDAARQARKAIEKGHRWLVVVGGDGTANEVVNGCFHNGEILDSNIQLGFLASGSGDDFVRSLKWPTSPSQALERLVRRKTITVDVGRVTFQNPQGKSEIRHFINIADFGLGAQVMKRVNASTKPLGSRLTYLYHSIASLISYRRCSVVMESGGKTYRFPEVVIGIVANGRYFGNGLCVAPEADLSDGFFNVIIVERFWVKDFLKLLPNLYRGGAVTGRNILRLKTKKIVVQPQDSHAVLIVTDGEQPGQLPATFEIVPRCLQVCV